MSKNNDDATWLAGYGKRVKKEAEMKEINFPDLSGESDKIKMAFCKEMIMISSKPLLACYLMFGFKTHIMGEIENDGVKFRLTFERILDESPTPSSSLEEENESPSKKLHNALDKLSEWIDKKNLKEENEKLRAILKELVELKDMKDRIDMFPMFLSIEKSAFKENYQTRKPLAWEAARKILITNTL